MINELIVPIPDPGIIRYQKLRYKIFLLGFILKYYKSASVDKSKFPTTRSLYKKIRRICEHRGHDYFGVVPNIERPLNLPSEDRMLWEDFWSNFEAWYCRTNRALYFAFQASKRGGECVYENLEQTEEKWQKKIEIIKWINYFEYLKLKGERIIHVLLKFIGIDRSIYLKNNEIKYHLLSAEERKTAFKEEFLRELKDIESSDAERRRFDKIFVRKWKYE